MDIFVGDAASLDTAQYTEGIVHALRLLSAAIDSDVEWDEEAIAATSTKMIYIYEDNSIYAYSNVTEH